MNRREFIQILAAAGVTASLPSIADDGIALYSMSHPEMAPSTTKELERAIESRYGFIGKESKKAYEEFVFAPLDYEQEVRSYRVVHSLWVNQAPTKEELFAMVWKDVKQIVHQEDTVIIWRRRPELIQHRAFDEGGPKWRLSFRYGVLPVNTSEWAVVSPKDKYQPKFSYSERA